jgi:hypothetical protein
MSRTGNPIYWISALVVSSACASHSTTGDPSGSANPTQAACDLVADAQCNISNRCLPYSVNQLWGSLAACKREASLSCAEMDRAPGTGAFWSKHSACAERLAERLSSMSCDEYLFSNAPSLDAECASTPGTLPDGAACGDNAQCQSTYCQTQSSDPFFCGVCAERSPLGGPCTTFQNCERGMACTNQICAARVAAGAECNSSRQCTPAFLNCIGLSATSTTGKCGKALELGAPCDPMYDECLWYTAGHFCDPSTNTCTQRKLAGVGEPCAFPEECRGDAFCDVTQKCVARAREGASCSVECTFGYTCFNSVCTHHDPSLCRGDAGTSASP